MKARLTSILFVIGLAAESPSAEPGLFDNPLKLFEGALVVALSNSERGKVQTTWRGFKLRADTQREFKSEHEPSEAGIYLDASVRDSVEIPMFSDSVTTEGGITTRIVKFPSLDKVQGLIVKLVYGSEANHEAIAALNRSIAEIIHKAEPVGARQPATRPESAAP